MSESHLLTEKEGARAMEIIPSCLGTVSFVLPAGCWITHSVRPRVVPRIPGKPTVELGPELRAPDSQLPSRQASIQRLQYGAVVKTQLPT